MQICSIRHRGLKGLVENDTDRELRHDQANRIRKVLAAPISAVDMDGVKGPPGWRVHQLTGNRAGTWSIAVSGNWRMTFTVKNGEVCDLDLEDYH